MPNAIQHGLNAVSSTFKHITRFSGSQGQLAQFLYPLSRDAVYTMFDFTNDTIDLNYWNVNQSGGGVNFAVLATPLANGAISAYSSATNASCCSLIGPAIYSGNANAGIEIRFKVNVATNIQFEMGFIDAGVTNTGTFVCTDIDVPTIANGVTDAALFAMDTSQTLVTSAFVTDGSTTNMNGTKTNAGTFVPTAATYVKCRIQLQNNGTNTAGAHFRLNDSNTLTANHGSTLASQIKGSVLLAPWILFKNNNAGNKQIDVDYVAVWSDRQ